MGKSNWTPWRGIEDLVDEMDRLTDGAGGRADPFRHGEAAGFWAPAADVVDGPDALVVEVELPGVRRGDIVLEVRDGELLVYGERRQVKEVSGAFLVMERSHGPFARAFPLPRGVDLDTVLAVFGNGLLTITLPKSGPRLARRSRIEISGG